MYYWGWGWVGPVQRGGWVSLRETMQWSVEPRLPCPTWVFVFSS